MLEIVLTPRIAPPQIGGPKLKPFQPNGKFAPDWTEWQQFKKRRKMWFLQI